MLAGEEITNQRGEREKEIRRHVCRQREDMASGETIWKSCAKDKMQNGFDVGASGVARILVMSTPMSDIFFTHSNSVPSIYKTVQCICNLI